MALWHEEEDLRQPTGIHYQIAHFIRSESDWLGNINAIAIKKLHLKKWKKLKDKKWGYNVVWLKALSQ